MIENEHFYSLEEVADILGVTYLLIYKLVRTGELPAMRVGKKYRVTGIDLNSYLNKQREAVKQDVLAQTCSLCGKVYFSALSISGECKLCGLPICRNCVELKHAHYCEIHQYQNNNASKETEKC